MRVWEVEPHLLCRSHLLGEHREIHAIWTFLTTDKGSAYRRHPETLRWIGKLPALKARHDAVAVEMKRRGWNHHSALETTSGSAVQDDFLLSVAEQKQLLRAKGCTCQV